MATAPVFATKPRIGIGQVSVANAAYDGSGTLATIFTGGADGTKISEIVIQATVTTTAGRVRLFLFDGTNTRLFEEIAVPAATGSATVSVARVSALYQNLTLPSNSWQIRASTHNAVTINVIVFGADL